MSDTVLPDRRSQRSRQPAQGCRESQPALIQRLRRQIDAVLLTPGASNAGRQ